MLIGIVEVLVLVLKRIGWKYREYLVEESKCGEYKDGDSFEIYNGGDEESGDGMVELKIKEKDLY